MAVFKTLTFDNENSLDYGVYITGEAVYNAPERAMEMVSIPGKNGAIPLDQGRFENISVKYPAGAFGKTQSEFASNIMKFRNVLASRYRYVRLSDDYNTDEFRLGMYRSGLETKPVSMSRAGEFDITFDCKPQRFLVSGETPQTTSDWSDVETETGDIVTIDADDTTAIKDLTADIEPIQSGSGTPSPDNVRPISGHTDVVVSRTGKNLCDTSLVYNGYINVSQQKIASNANARTLYLPCKPNTTYTVSKQAGQRFVVAESTVIPTNNVVVSNVVSDYTASSITITTTASAKYLVAFVYLSTADTGVTADQMLATCQIELGETATTYEAYQVDTYTTALGTTVYGGTLDVTTGVLTVTHKMVDMGSLTYTYYTDATRNDFFTPLTDAITPIAGGDTTAICSCYANHGFTSMSNGSFCVSDANLSSGTKYFIVRDTGYTSASDFKTAVTGQTLVYELATPTTTTLTAQQISTLLGQNNVWADTGDVTVEYGVPPFTNPTMFPSNPLIKVTGIGTLTVGDTSIVITGTASQVIYIDCESMEIYKIIGGVITPAGSLVSFSTPDFPKLMPGINTVTMGTGITDVEITPRWWRI